MFSWNKTSKSLDSTTHGQGGHQDDVDIRGKRGPSINPNRTLARFKVGQKGPSPGTLRKPESSQARFKTSNVFT